jgi:tetratricopeptide (TPR) repeat protein
MAVSRRSLPFLFAVLVFSTLPVHGGEIAWPVARGPSREPNPVRFDRKMIAALPRDFLDDSAACILYAGNTYLVEPDGTVETITHDLTRLNSRKSIEKLGEYRNITYDPSYQKLTLNEARIHKPDGKIVNVEARHVQMRDVATDFLVYDHDKQLIISFPTLEVGDVIEVKWTVRGRNPEYGGHFFTRYSFGDANYPVALDEIRIQLPTGVPFTYASINGKVVPTITHGGEHVTYHWKMSNVPRPPQDENLPSREERTVAVACSTFGSWKDVGLWKHKLRGEVWKCTPDIAAIVRDVTKDITDPTEKARALAYWLRRNIRYVSVGEKHDYTPHTPSLVAANRFGDCKDTSQMLAVMLREAGLKVELATLGAADDGQVIEDVPSPWGTHAILLVTIGKAKHWIDTTSSLSDWDFLPRDDRNRLCYLVDDKGNVRLEKTPPSTAGANRIEQTTQIWVGSDGSARGERAVVSYGSAALTQRDAFLEVPSGERRRQVASELQDSNSRTRLVRLEVDEPALRELDKPVSVKMVFEINNLFTGTSEKEGSFTDNKVWNKFIAFNLDYDRKTPMELPAIFESVHRYTIYLPAAYVLDDQPSSKTIRSKWGVFTIRVTPQKEDSHIVEFESAMRLHTARVEPDDFDEYRKFHEDVTRSYRVWLTLHPTRSLADAPRMEAVLALAPEDAGTAAELARLYQLNGEDAEARRVLRTALVYNPDDMRLWELSVKAAKNMADEEDAQRELVRRFPEELKYTVELAAVLINRDKYDEARTLLEPLTKRSTPAAIRAQAHYQFGRAHYRRDQLKEAVSQLDLAEKADPEAVNSVRFFTLRGQALEEMNDLDAAIKAYERALVVDRQATAALDALARLNLAVGRKPEGLNYLRRYVLAVGSEPAGLLLAAESYVNAGQFDDALDLADRVNEPRYKGKIEGIRGRVWAGRGDRARALEHLCNADPTPPVLETLLRLRLSRGEVIEAEPSYAKAKEMDKQSDGLKKQIALYEQLTKRAAELAHEPNDRKSPTYRALGAVACAEYVQQHGSLGSSIEEIIAAAPAVDAGPVLAWKAYMAIRRGRLIAALPDAEKAVAASPTYALGWYVRGRIRMERGTPGAIPDLSRAAELTQRKDADVLQALAEALYRGGKFKEAVTVQRVAVQLRPTDAELKEQLAVYERDAEKSGSTGQ